MVDAAVAGMIPRTHDHNGARNGAPPPASTLLAMGEAAPEIDLPNLRGGTTKLSDFRGRNTLVLFWNPACGFCQSMLDDLRAWEKSRGAEAPELLVVSTDDVETNRAMELRSHVLLDDSFKAGRAFGAAGTPVAVLVDEEGRVASALGVGTPAVMSLMHEGSDAASAATGA